MSKFLGSVLQWIVDLAVLNTYRGYTLDEGLGGLDTSQLNKLNDGMATGDVSDNIHSSDVGRRARPDHLDDQIKSNDVDCSVQSNNLNQKVQPSEPSKVVYSSFRNDHVQLSTPLQSVLPSNNVGIVQTNTITPIDFNHPNTISDSNTLDVSDVRIPNIPIKTKEPKILSIFGMAIPSFPRASSSGKLLGLLDVPELSRTTTRESSFGTSARSPERIYAFRCPSCRNTRLCGCSLRAGSLHSNRKKDFGFCTDTKFEQTYYPLSKPDDSKNGTQGPLPAHRVKNNAWQGYRSVPDIRNCTPLSPTDPQSTEEVNLVKRQQGADEDGMVGLGCYRFAKDASKEEIINNTIEKLGDLAPLTSNLAIDGVKVYGYKDITYDDILRKKYEREFPDRSTPYEKHLTKDGTTVHIGFPGGVAQQRDDNEHLRFHTWIDHIPSLQEWQLAQWRHSGRFPRDREPTEKQQEPPKQCPPKRQQHVRFADQAVADAKTAALLGTAPVAPSVVPSLGEGAHPLAQRAPWQQHLRQPAIVEEQ